MNLDLLNEKISRSHDQTIHKHQTPSFLQIDRKFFCWIWNITRHLIRISTICDHLNWRVDLLTKPCKFQTKHIKFLVQGSEDEKTTNIDWNRCCWCHAIHEKIGFIMIFTNRKKHERSNRTRSSFKSLQQIIHIVRKIIFKNCHLCRIDRWNNVCFLGIGNMTTTQTRCFHIVTCNPFSPIHERRVTNT